MSKNSKLEHLKIPLHGADPLVVFGPQDRNLKAMQTRFGATILLRNGELHVKAQPGLVEPIKKVLNELMGMAHRGQEVREDDLDTIMGLAEEAEESPGAASDDSFNSTIIYGKKDYVRPKSAGQDAYVRAVAENDIVFAIGPAGTGKTYLAVAIALAYFRDKIADRIVLARPAVEAGESLGFLPGDFREKVDPYLRPLYDALYQMVPSESLRKYMESRVMEIVPLAYMRGRTLNNAFVILDEAQNTSPNQMKMFLTRLGVNSKAIITGDITQIDLPGSITSGLVQIQDILKGIDGIKFVYFSEQDVVRHRLVKDIIRAYGAFEDVG